MEIYQKNNAGFIALRWTGLFFVIGMGLLLLYRITDPSYQQNDNFLSLRGAALLILVSAAFYLITHHLLVHLVQKIDRGEEFIETAINSVPGIFFVIDENGKMVRWNDNSNEIYGLSDKQLDNSPALDRVEPDDRNKAEAALNRVWEQGYMQTELNLKTKYKEESIYRIIGRKFTNNQKRYIVGTGLNITESIHNQEKLKRQNYRLQAAQQIARLGYWESNLEDNRLIWSDIVYELFGVDQETFTPTVDNFLALVHPEDRDIHTQSIRRLTTDGSFEAEYRVKRPDGSIGWFKEIGEVFQTKNGDPSILHGVITEITEQKQMEHRIRHAYIDGENKERKRIATELHDGIAQYLSAAILHFDSADKGIDQLDNQQQEQLKTVRRLIKEAVSETRTIARNLMPITIDTYGLAAAIHSLTKQYQLSTDIDISFNNQIESLQKELSDKIKVNAYRIIQELLSNAVRHSNCNRIWVTLQSESGKLICTVSDNGRGGELPDPESSSGLGFRSIYERVQLLSGKIDIANKPGRGLRIRTIIPLEQH